MICRIAIGVDDAATACRNHFFSTQFLFGTAKQGVGTELAVVQKYGKQDSGTAEYLPSPQGK